MFSKHRALWVALFVLCLDIAPLIVAVHGRGEILEQSTLPYRMIKLICVIIRPKNHGNRSSNNQNVVNMVMQLLTVKRFANFHFVKSIGLDYVEVHVEKYYGLFFSML